MKHETLQLILRHLEGITAAIRKELSDEQPAIRTGYVPPYDPKRSEVTR